MSITVPVSLQEDRTSKGSISIRHSIPKQVALALVTLETHTPYLASHH